MSKATQREGGSDHIPNDKQAWIEERRIDISLERRIDISLRPVRGQSRQVSKGRMRMRPARGVVSGFTYPWIPGTGWGGSDEEA